MIPVFNGTEENLRSWPCSIKTFIYDPKCYTTSWTLSTSWKDSKEQMNYSFNINHSGSPKIDWRSVSNRENPVSKARLWKLQWHTYEYWTHYVELAAFRSRERQPIHWYIKCIHKIIIDNIRLSLSLYIRHQGQRSKESLIRKSLFKLYVYRQVDSCPNESLWN